MPRLLVAALAVFGLACNIHSSRHSPTPDPQAAVPHTALDPLRVLEQKIFAAVNEQRRGHGLRDLRWSDQLAQEARAQSVAMMERGFFAHLDPARGGLSARLSRAGIRWLRCGENIYREKGFDDPVTEAVEGWMKSHGHRQSILDPAFTASGVGIAISPDTEYFLTQIFVRPRDEERK